jgi:hypothetical protein
MPKTPHSAVELADLLMQDIGHDDLIDEAAVLLRRQDERIKALLGVRDATLEMTKQLAEHMPATFPEGLYSALLGVVSALAVASAYDADEPERAKIVSVDCADGLPPTPERT